MTKGRTADEWGATRVRDRELVRRCLRKDQDAWTEVWERYGPLVKAVARRVGCDDEEVREVLQRAALVALEGLHRLHNPEKLAGWLAGVARFQALELRRSRRPSEELFESTAVAEPRAEEHIRRDQAMARLWRAFLQLDPRCQRLLFRLELKEPADAYRDVAEAEDLSPTSIGPIRRRCLTRLRALIERDEGVSIGRPDPLPGEGDDDGAPQRRPTD